MKDWPWQKWVGRVILLVLAGFVALLDLFPGIEIPWWMIILPAATQVAQWFIAWLPGTAWQQVVGKALLLAVAIVEIALGELGVTFEPWIALVPLVGALAQWLISKAPEGEAVKALNVMILLCFLLVSPLVLTPLLL